jgi:nucleotide-binding universal stress UspA family protein
MSTHQPTQTLRKQVETCKKISLAKIMVLIDFSTVSDLALEYAVAMARRYDARIFLTHIISPESYILAEPGLAEMTYEKVRAAAEQSMADILISGRLRGIPHEAPLQEGTLWPAVERLIQQHQIDLVVSGSTAAAVQKGEPRFSGRSGFPSSGLCGIDGRSRHAQTSAT